MKTMHMLLGLSLSLVLSLSSCNKDSIQPKPSEKPQTEVPDKQDGAGQIPPDTVGKDSVVKDTVIMQPPSGTGTLLVQMGNIKLGYDAQQRIASYESYSNMGYTVVYEGDKPTRLNFTKHSGHVIYHYDGNRVAEVVVYNGYNEVSYRYKFAYEGDKLKKETQISYVTNPNGWLIVNDYSYDSHDNLTQITVSAAQSGLEKDLKFSYDVKFGNYDNQTNPMPYVTHQFFLPGIKLYKNNPGYRITPSSKELFSYVYSDKGMPTERALRLEGYSTPPEITRYVYQ